MAYPVLAAQSTWFAPTISTVKRANITEIEIMDSYRPDTSVTVTNSWDASAAKDGSITCYVVGTKLIIAGNGSGKIASNEDSSYAFSVAYIAGVTSDKFKIVSVISGLNLIDVSGVTNMRNMFDGCSAIKSLGLSNWNVSNVTNMASLFSGCSSLTSLNISNWNTSQVSDMNCMFSSCSALTSLDVSNWDVSKVTNMRLMFGFSGVKTLNIANWDTSSVTNMGRMFYQTQLTSLDIANWDVSNVTDMSEMFGTLGTSYLVSLDVSNWDTSNVTDMSLMFSNCKALTSLDVSKWDTSNVTNMKNMFNYCSALTTLNIANWDVSSVTNMSMMFYFCKALTSLDVSKWDTSSVTNMANIFAYCSALTTLNIANWDVSNVTDMSQMFDGCSALKLLDVYSRNTNGVANMEKMFRACKALTSLNVSNWDVSSVTNMNYMFAQCNSLASLDVSKWDTSSATIMSFMFYECYSLGEIDVSNWDVSKVTNFDHFAAHANLKRKGIENWKTTSATNMNALFHNCAEEELDLSGWDVSKNQFFCQMFENSPNLKRIKGLDKWNTSAGLGFDGMFERCSKLEEVDLSSFNTTKAKNNTSASTNGHKTATMQNMFLSCNNLKKVTVGPNFAVNGDGSNITAGNKAILPTPSATYIDGADGNWYTLNGDTYAPNAMKDKTAETYYASYDLVADIDIIVKNGSMIDIAKAIREKNGTTNHYTPAQFGAAIRAL